MVTDPQPGRTVGPLRWQAVLASVLLGAGFGWLVFAIPDEFGWPLPQIPMAPALLIAVSAISSWVLAGVTHRRIQVRHQHIDPHRAVTLLALAKTCVLAGAGLAAGYGAVIVTFVPRMAAELPRQRVLVSVVAVISGVVLAGAGIFLERACRVPRPPKGDAPKDVRGNAENSH
jgi:hypothetical protein